VPIRFERVAVEQVSGIWWITKRQKSLRRKGRRGLLAEAEYGALYVGVEEHGRRLSGLEQSVLGAVQDGVSTIKHPLS
jgi:hypothetical protein